MPSLRTLARRLSGADRGNVAMIVALAIPALSMLTVGAVELGFLVSDKGKLQEAADAAALATAHELALAVETGATARAEAMALAQVAPLIARGTVTAEAEVVEEGAGIRVRLTAHRDSFFGNLLPPGGFTTHAESVAIGMGRTPLCVLVLGTSKSKDKALNAKDTGLMRASGCLVHSNQDIVVEGSASISAGAVQSVAETTGSVTPKAGVGAEPIEDPFAVRNLTPKGSCQNLVDLVVTTVTLLAPGNHCKKIEAKANASITLLPGVHYFTDGELKIAENARLYGKDVVMIFDEKSKFTFQDKSTVDLYGRESGEFAGFLIVTTRNNTSDFSLLSDNVRNLLGVIYIPAAKLIVEGKDQVAENSPWTVVVAQRMELKGSPTLVINRNYAVGGVPVPAGVGNQRSGVRLSH